LPIANFRLPIAGNADVPSTLSALRESCIPDDEQFEIALRALCGRDVRAPGVTLPRPSPFHEFFIRLNSQAFAARQSRRTVIAEISRTSAVSSRPSPPK